MMIRSYILVFLLFLASIAHATIQKKDSIIFEGISYPVQYLLMEDYFKSHPDKKPVTDCYSTGLEREYIATFEIIENQIFLNDITIIVKEQGSEDCKVTSWKSVIHEVFPGIEKVSADWFSGVIVLPSHLISQTEMAYSSIYERYSIFEIVEGKITLENELNFEQYTLFKEKQFQSFKESGEYEKLSEKLVKSWGPEFTENYLKEYAIWYVKKIVK